MSSGVQIERGRVISADYKVESLSRPGLTTRPLQLIAGIESIALGAYVYFFMFEDGTGLILGEVV